MKMQRWWDEKMQMLTVREVDALAYADSRAAEARKQEREEIVTELEDYSEKRIRGGSEWVARDLHEIIDRIRSREPGPTKLEKVDEGENDNLAAVLRKTVPVVNALVDATNANTEAIARMGGKT